MFGFSLCAVFVWGVLFVIIDYLHLIHYLVVIRNSSKKCKFIS